MNSVTERLTDIDLNLLLSLDALLDVGSVTGAAERLGMSQPAVSQKLRRLREMLDDPLLVNTGGRLQPTQKAMELRSPLRRALDELADVVLGERSFEPAQSETEFVIAAQDLFERVVLPQILDTLSIEAPGVRLRVVPTDPRTDERLESGEVDFVIGPYASERPGLRRFKLAEDGFAVIARAGHPAMQGRFTLAKYLRGRHAIVSPRGSPGTFVDSILAKSGKTRMIAVQVSSFLAVPHVVVGSDLFASVPTQLADAVEGSLPLQRAKLPFHVPSVPTFLTWHERFERAPAHRWFREQARAFSRST